jgi:hypothetical protein
MLAHSTIPEYFFRALQSALDGDYLPVFKLLCIVVESFLLGILVFEFAAWLFKYTPHPAFDYFLTNHEAKRPIRLAILWYMCAILLIIHILELITVW